MADPCTVLVIDKCTGYARIYLVKLYTDFYNIYVSFKTMIVAQFSIKIKTLRSDSGEQRPCFTSLFFCSNRFLGIFRISCGSPWTPLFFYNSSWAWLRISFLGLLFGVDSSLFLSLESTTISKRTSGKYSVWMIQHACKISMF